MLRSMSDGETTVTWRELEVAVTAAVFVDRESLGANHLMLVAWSLPTISAVLTSALTLGMDTESRGSMRAALHYFVAFVREQRRSSPDEFTFSRPASFKTLPAVDVTALTPQTLWVSELQLRSGIDAGFDAVVLAALINLLPNRYHPAGRKTTDFMDSAGELFDEAVAQQPDVASKRPNRQASSIVGAIRARVPDAKFISYCAPESAFEEAQVYRRKSEDTVQERFHGGWQFAYPALKSLLTDTCPASEAWSHVAMLLEDKPTYESLSALNFKVEGLIGIVDSDPELKPGVGTVELRARAMLKILSLPVSSVTGNEGAQSSSAQDRADLTTKSSTQDLLAELHKEDTTPKVPHRVIRTMLTAESMVGWQYLSGKQPALEFLKRFVACRNEAAVVQAFKRHMCVDEAGKKQQGWYPSLDTAGKCTLPMRLLKGDFAANGALNFNPWLDAVGPLVKRSRGNFAVSAEVDSLAKANPAAMFTNAFMLKYGSKHLVRLFDFIGASGTGDNSLEAMLLTVESYTERLDLIPDQVPNYSGMDHNFAGAKNTCKMDLQDAAVACFVEFASEIQAALQSPPLTSTRPKPFVPEGGGFKAGLVEISEMLEQMEGDVKSYLRLARSTERAAAQQGLALPPTGSRSGSSEFSVGPSVSQVGTPSMAPLTSEALAALQSQTRTPSEFTRLNNTVIGSAAGADQGKRGSLVATLRYEGGGIWVDTKKGPVWCSAKGKANIDLNRLCAAAILPKYLDGDLYCTNGAKCQHVLPRSYTAVHSRFVVAAADLITKPKEGGGRGGGGKGAKDGAQRGRGKGRGKGAGRNGKRKANADDEPLDQGDA